jgi:hypothetical protein
MNKGVVVNHGVCYDLVEYKKYRYYFLENGVIFHSTNHENLKTLLHSICSWRTSMNKGVVALHLFMTDINEEGGRRKSWGLL